MPTEIIWPPPPMTRDKVEKARHRFPQYKPASIPFQLKKECIVKVYSPAEGVSPPKLSALYHLKDLNALRAAVDLLLEHDVDPKDITKVVRLHNAQGGDIRLLFEEFVYTGERQRRNTEPEEDNSVETVVRGYRKLALAMLLDAVRSLDSGDRSIVGWVRSGGHLFWCSLLGLDPSRFATCVSDPAWRKQCEVYILP